MGKIQEKIEYARSKVTDNNLRHAKMDIEDLMEVIKRKKAENPKISTDEILAGIEQKYNDVVFNNVGITLRNGRIEAVPSVTRSDFFLLKTISYLRKHPEKIFETIDQSDRNKLATRKSYYTYTANMKNNIQECLNDICSRILAMLDDLSFTEKFVNGELSFKERSALQNKILNSFSFMQVKLDQNIRISYARHISELAKILDENGCFECGIRRHNSRLSTVGLENFQEKNEDKKGNRAQIRNMSDWKNTNIVNKLSFEALIAASAFFTNRACKEYISFKRAAFLLRELGILNQIDSKVQIDMNLLKEALGKYEFIQSEARDDFSRITIQDDAEVELNRAVSGNYRLEYTPEEAEEYRLCYSALLPDSKNEIFSDRKNFAIFYDVMEGLYTKKDFAIDTLVATLLKRDISWNWGYIPEINNNCNSIQSGKRMVALGFDIEGFNMPIRLHCSLSKLRDLVKEYTGKSDIPVYQGSEDWSLERKDGKRIDITTQILRQTTKAERKDIKTIAENINESDETFGFVTHLNWIANRIVPERYYSGLVVSLDNGTIRTIDQRTYDD